MVCVCVAGCRQHGMRHGQRPWQADHTLAILLTVRNIVATRGSTLASSTTLPPPCCPTDWVPRPRDPPVCLGYHNSTLPLPLAAVDSQTAASPNSKCRAVLQASTCTHTRPTTCLRCCRRAHTKARAGFFLFLVTWRADVEEDKN